MLIIPIKSDIDIFKARRAGREMAREMGFHSRDYTSIEITISELATNIVKYAVEGIIRLEVIEDGLQIVSEDWGKGIEDIARALQGKGASVSGLGIGLAGVKRLMDQLEIKSEIGRGTKIVARKWKKTPRHLITPQQDYPVPVNGLLQYGVISTPCYGDEFNGDAFVIKEFGRKILLAVIDGLGHGKSAYLPARTAIDCVQENYQNPPDVIIRECHKALYRTRGVVMGLVQVDLERSKLIYAGVGNITVKVVGQKPVKPVSTSGIVGHKIWKQLRAEEFPYSKGDTIYIYSDGISSRFEPDKLEVWTRNPRKIAEDVVREFGKNGDDATIIVAREGG